MKVAHLLLVVAFVASGCGRKAEDPSFAVIDGWPLTESFVKDIVLIQARLSELGGRPIPKKAFTQWANEFATKSVPSLISSRLWEAEALRIGLSEDPADVADVVKGYGEMIKRPVKSVDELADLFGDQADAFRAQLRREALFRTYERKILEVKVLDYQLAGFLSAKTNELNQVKEVNAKAKRKANEAWNELNAGNPWEKVAKKYSEDSENGKGFENYWKFWGIFRLQDMYLQPLVAPLAVMRKGGYTNPIETDDGIVIAKVLDVDKDGLYTCARILIRTAYPVDIPTVEEARKRLYKFNLESRLKDLQIDLRAKATITYPLGTNFMYAIWKDVPSSEK